MPNAAITSAKQVGHHARRRHGIQPRLLQCFHIWNRGLRILFQNDAPQSVRQAQSILAGANHDAADHRILLLGQVQLVAGILVETKFLYIANHADYTTPMLAPIQGHSFSGGILLIPVMARQAAIDHRHGRRLFVIRFQECPAAHQRNSQRLKVVGAGYPYGSHRHSFSFRHWMIFDNHFAAPSHPRVGIHGIAG
jgi:hypothetical protein